MQNHSRTFFQDSISIITRAIIIACHPRQHVMQKRNPRHTRQHLTYASMPPTPPTLARHSPKHTTHTTHASTSPTPHTLAHYPRKRATHASTNNTPFLKNVKSYYLNLNFFQVLQSAPLEKEKNISKKMQATQKLLGIARGRRKTLRKHKEKRKMRKSQTKIIIIFLPLLFYIEKFIEKKFGKTCLYCHISIKVFSRDSLLEMQQQKTNAHIDMHQFCRRRTSTQNSWHQTSYFNVDFDSNELLFHFFIFQKSTFNLEKNKSIC